MCIQNFKIVLKGRIKPTTSKRREHLERSYIMILVFIGIIFTPYRLLFTDEKTKCVYSPGRFTFISPCQ